MNTPAPTPREDQRPSTTASESSSADAPAPSPDIFATTRWTVVLAAGQKGSPQAAAALEELCRTYWFPLYVYVRRQGCSHEDAEDLTQAFFARFLERDYPEGLSSEKGRFRAFLLAAMKHFLANAWEYEGRQKRGGGASHLSFDWQGAERRYGIDLADPLSPDKLYDRTWAVLLLDRVITRLREEHEAGGKAELFEELKPFVTVGKSAIPYEQAAAQLNQSEATLRVTVHRLRRRYRELLREEVARTLADPAQAEEEMRALLSAFSD